MTPTEAQIEKAKRIAEWFYENDDLSLDGMLLANLAEAIAEAEKPPEGWIEVRVAVAVDRYRDAWSSAFMKEHSEAEALAACSGHIRHCDFLVAPFVMRCFRPPVKTEVVEGECQ